MKRRIIIGSCASLALGVILATAGWSSEAALSGSVKAISETSTTAVLTVTATDANAAEAGTNTAAFSIARAGDATTLTVNFTLSGTATYGVDYSLSGATVNSGDPSATTLTGTVSLPASASAATLLVTPVDDTTVEASETIIVTLAAGTGYSVGSPASATANLADNDSSENHAPVIVSGPLATVLDRSATLLVSASDADSGDTLTYTWEKVSGPGSVSVTPNGNSAAHDATASFSAAGDYVLRVVVSDGKATVEGTASLTITAEVTEQTMNLEAFIARFYFQAFARQPEKDGLKAWVDGLLGSTSTGADVARGFIFSQEFLNRNLSNSDFLDVLYNAFFDRAGDTAGKSAWTTSLEGGMLREDVVNGFIFATEFQNLCQRYSITAYTSTQYQQKLVRDFIRRFYITCLNREPDANGISGWYTQLVSGTSKGGDIARAFINSQEFKNRNLSNSDYVDVLYQAFFNRSADTSGKTFWINVLDAGQSRESVLESFIGSAEFANLATSYGIQP